MKGYNNQLPNSTTQRLDLKLRPNTTGRNETNNFSTKLQRQPVTNNKAAAILVSTCPGQKKNMRRKRTTGVTFRKPPFWLSNNTWQANRCEAK